MKNIKEKIFAEQIQIITTQALKITELEILIFKSLNDIDDLKRRSGLNGSNTSKPLYSDGLTAPAVFISTPQTIASIMTEVDEN